VCEALTGTDLDLDALQAALQAGSSPADPCPIAKSRRRSLSLIEVMIGIVIPPIGVLMLADPGREGYTAWIEPLTLAIGWGSGPAVDALLAAGADPLGRNDAHQPLTAAIRADAETDAARFTHRLLGDRRLPADLLCSDTALLDDLRDHPVLAGRLDAAGLAPGGADCDGRTWLHRAAAGGDTAQVVGLLDAGRVPLDARDHRGRSALFAAAHAKQWDTAQLLLDRGAALTGAGGEAGTMLHAAAAAGRLDWTDRALQAGLPVDGVDEGGQTPLSAAVRGGHRPVVARLLDAGADPAAGQSRPGDLLVELVRRGDRDLLALLLDAGVPVGARGAFDQTPLVVAFEREDLETGRLLVERGARPEAAPPPTFSGRPTFFERVIEAGPSPWTDLLVPVASEYSRRSALVHCLITDHLDGAVLLLDTGLDPADALVTMAALGDSEMVAWLRARGARYPQDALLRMLPEAPLAMVADALADGARWDAAAEHRTAPVEAALEARDTALLSLLVQHGAQLGEAGDLAVRQALWEDHPSAEASRWPGHDSPEGPRGGDWVTALLDLGAPVSEPTLRRAIDSERADLMPALLDRAQPTRRQARGLLWAAWWDRDSACERAVRDWRRAQRR